MWAGKINFESGGYLVAVEYDSDETAAALRRQCATWLSSDASDIPAAFGVRVARVGIRRRQVGVVHHGAPVRHRLDGADAAVEAIATFLDEFAHHRPEGLVAVKTRVFTRGGNVALLDIPLTIDVDERPLRRIGITEVPTYRPLLDPTTSLLTVNNEAHPLVGVAVMDTHVQSLDDARRRIWSLGDGPRLSWAQFIDQLGDRVVWDAPDLASAIDHALS